MLGQLSLFVPDKKLSLKNRIELVIVSRRESNYVLKKFHYLHRARAGCQINYAILIDGEIDGVITYAYPMMSDPILGIPSDEMVEFARLFLKSNIPHSASCAIGKSLRRIKSDWANMFPNMKSLKLVISWSDTTLHKGIIYKASNFQWLRRTKGTYTGGSINVNGIPRKNYKDFKREKDCWIYYL